MTNTKSIPKYLLLGLLVLQLSCQSGGERLFSLLEPSYTGIDFANELDENERFNIIKYLYFYNGAGVATGDVNNDGLPDVFFTSNQHSNKLYLNKGDFRFEDVTASAGLKDVEHAGRSWKTGVSMADVNGDGWLDIYVCEVGYYKSINGRNKLYINQGPDAGGQVRFEEQASAYGLDFKGFAQQSAFFDYDLDGDLDLLLVAHSVHSAESYARGEQRTVRDSLSRDVLYRNDDNHFYEVGEQSGIFGGPMGYGLGLVVSDLNGDGWPDIYITNDFHEHDYLYLNNGNRMGLPQFTEQIAAATGHTSTFSMGVDAADLNNDGLCDIMSLDMKPEDEQVLKASAGADHYNLYQMKLSYGYHYQFPRNCLQLAQGNQPTAGGRLPRYAEVAELSGVAATDWSWGTLLADFDNDGWKDIFVTNGIWRRPNDLDYLRYSSGEQAQRYATDLELAAKMPQGAVGNYAFRNACRSAGEVPLFENASQAWGLNLKGYSNGAAWADFDQDGDLDLVVNNLNSTAAMYRNEAGKMSGNNYLRIKLEGGGSNRFGIGARVLVQTPGNSQLQELSPTRGWLSSSDHCLVFGLGKATSATSVTVIWPGGKTQSMQQVNANQTLVLRQQEAGSSPGIPSEDPLPLLSALPFPGNAAPLHTENRFTDFNIEPLLPYLLSTQGPGLALADLNGDGQDDFYLCGAKGQAGQLWLSAGDGQWQPTEQPAFAADFLFEDVEACFLDVEKDGDMDLFVVSGGGEYRPGAEQLRHRLYRNDSRGSFSRDPASFPSSNGACVVPGDFNGDGATDLFVGSRSVPGSYGLSPQSFLLINDGSGHFSDAAEELFPGLSTAGMVTSAAWMEAEQRLAVAGEWMGVKIWERGQKAALEIPHSNGLWNALSAADWDGDGDLDLMAGNWGENSTWRASGEQPMSLFVKDFDQNGATDPVLAYHRQGKRYTFASRDELAGQMPDLKKQFVQYGAFASSTFEQVFPDGLLQGAQQWRVEQLKSCYFENQGGGRFEMRPLPAEVQTGPVQALLPGDFDGDGRLDVLLAGNWLGVQPSLGRQDALQGNLLKGDGAGNFEAMPASQHGFYVPGEVRDLRLARGMAGQSWILVARNNAAVLAFSKQQ
jgi:hypothetical protein